VTRIQNPILPGFNPDPSICRVGDDFYVATSTFEWFPGVQIWHSQNLKDWRLLTRPLNEPRLLNLRGVQSSAGIWAPCLSFHDGIFYLVYTVVSKWRGETPVDAGCFKDTPNFLTTTNSLENGLWSDPVYLNASGFDPSFFHDDNGKTWLTNMEWDYRGDPTYFSGIVLQEYSKAKQMLVGPVRKIFTGSPIGRTEGPHVYKRNGWYYLMTAEGGTSYEHAVSLARSKQITGPYEIHPKNPLLQSFENRTEDKKLLLELAGSSDNQVFFPEHWYSRPQRAGHGSMCILSEKEWALVHLCGRPIQGSIACTRGRETAVQRIIWKEDDWPYVVDEEEKENNLAEFSVSFTWENENADTQSTHFSFTDTFNDPQGINPHFRFLRHRPGMRQDSDKGCLYLQGKESPVSEINQSLVAVSVPFSDYRIETRLHYSPKSFQQMAGLLVRYDERNQYYLHITYDELRGCVIGVLRFIKGVCLYPTYQVAKNADEYRFAAEIRGLSGQYFYGDKQGKWKEIGPELDMRQLSDEYTWPEGFTGTFAGMGCHDLTGKGTEAMFTYFSMHELQHV